MRTFALWLLWFGILFAPVTQAQQNFSWFGNQIIKNDTESIPGRRTYVFHFQMLENGVARVDVDSEGSGELDVYLINSAQYSDKDGQGRIKGWLDNEEGAKTQIVRQLSPGDYYVLITNASSSSRRAGIRVWTQKR